MLPLYPETTGGAHPVCTDVQKLRAAKVEGRKAVQEAIGVPLGLTLPVDSMDEDAEVAVVRDQQQQERKPGGVWGSWSGLSTGSSGQTNKTKGDRN